MMELTAKQLAALVEAAKSNPEFAMQQAFRFGLAATQSHGAQETIQRAAELLDHEAEMLRESHAPDRNWSGEADAKADYDEFKRVASGLRSMQGET